VPIALAAHGGAWNIPREEVPAHLAGLRRALAEGWKALREGRSSLDTVELVVRILEDDPTFNAGRGAHLNQEGKLELDASIMDGATLKVGAVAAIRGVRHPISVARAVMERTRHVLLVGAGARKFAREAGAELCRDRDLLIGRELERYLRIRRGEQDLVQHEFTSSRPPHGTVGAVALDRAGHVAAATSTGGTLDKAPGRVGDTPIPGAGTYADDRAGAASSTGWGEAILRVVLAKTAVDRLARGESPAAAAREALRALERVNGRGGILLLDRRGGVAAAFNTPRMARGRVTEREGLKVLVGRERS